LFEPTGFFLLSFSIPEELTLQHSRDLEAQRNEAAKLKDQLIQAGLQHVRALKEAISAGDAKVEEARKEIVETAGQLRAELEEDTWLLHLEQDRNAELVVNQASLDQMIIDTDAQALSKCHFSLCLPSCVLYRCILIQLSFDFSQSCFQTTRHARMRGSPNSGPGTLFQTPMLPGMPTTTSPRCTPGSRT
jgi:hypothetical protein